MKIRIKGNPSLTALGREAAFWDDNPPYFNARLDMWDFAAEANQLSVYCCRASISLLTAFAQ